MEDKTRELIDELTEMIEGDVTEFTPQAELDDIIKTLGELRTPIDLLKDGRLEKMGKDLFKVSHDSLHPLTNKSIRGLPMLSVKVERLESYLSLLHKMGVMDKAVRNDRVIGEMPQEAQTTIFQYLNELMVLEEAATVVPVDKEDRDYLIGELSAAIYHKACEAIDEKGVSIFGGSLNLVRSHSHIDDDAVNRIPHYKTLAEKAYKYYNDSDLDGFTDGREFSVVSTLFAWEIHPSTPQTSQNARGIQKLTELNNTYSWVTRPCVFLPLLSVVEGTKYDIITSLTVSGVVSISDFSNDRPLYIRTCPSTPRPGGLPNIKAITQQEVVEGAKFLANSMLNPNHADYDPNGVLCVMAFEESVMSAVLARYQDTIVCARGNAGVTAAQGGAIIIQLNHNATKKIENDIQRCSLDDGYDYHELEFVWPKEDEVTGQIWHPHRSISVGKSSIEASPILTQLRGLATQKPDIKPASTFEHPETGEIITTTIRGNVPAGFVVQQAVEDVGRGDLADCAKLEKMINDGDIPDGLVVYCPSGSPNAHAAGVCSEHVIPIIYGIQPCDDGITWTEINSWVTTVEGVEPLPYDPSPFKEYFFIGCKEGDRYWDYGYHVLSQFFHTFINGPLNDPRFEAYLAGFFASWVIKASIAVALGEARYGFQSRAKYFPVHGAITITIAEGLANKPEDENPIKDWAMRDVYYSLLRCREVGLESLYEILAGLTRVYEEDVNWPDSYGGKNYRESCEKGMDAVKSLMNFRDGKVSIQEVLNRVNVLENAVHNCNFFFDKFVANKQYFEIGTRNHSSLNTIPQQFIIASALHTRFYTQIVDEPHMIWQDAKIYKSGVVNENGYKVANHRLLTELLPRLSREDIHSSLHSYSEHLEESTKRFTTTAEKPFHELGVCGLLTCLNEKCVESHLLDELGLNTKQTARLSQIICSEVGGSSGGGLWKKWVHPLDAFSGIIEDHAPKHYDPHPMILSSPNRLIEDWSLPFEIKHGALYAKNPEAPNMLWMPEGGKLSHIDIAFEPLVVACRDIFKNATILDILYLCDSIIPSDNTLPPSVDAQNAYGPANQREGLDDLTSTELLTYMGLPNHEIDSISPTTHGLIEMTTDLILHSEFPTEGLYDNYSKKFHFGHPSDWRYWPLQNILMKMARIMLEEKIINNSHNYGTSYTWESPSKLQPTPATVRGNYSLFNRVGGLKNAIDILLANSNITTSDLAALADRHTLHLQQEEEK